MSCARLLTGPYGVSYFRGRRNRRSDPSGLGRRIKALRSAARLSVREVATRGDIPHSIVHGLETGWQQTTSVERLRKIAAGLGVTVAELLGDESATVGPKLATG